MDNNSIISIPDSDADTTTNAAMNSTFSPQKPTLTPKKELDSTINTTFTPEDKKTLPQEVPETPQLDTTFSPVKDDVPPMEEPPARSMIRTRSKTPIREAVPGDASSKFDSPERSPLPEIVIVPPSTERKRNRNSKKSPTKRITMTPVRRSMRHTPMKPVVEVVVGAKEVITNGHKAANKPIPTEVTAPMVQSPVLLKSIRKRSMSVTDLDPPVTKRNFRVQFHSPANMERTITEIDESLHLNYSRTFAAPEEPAAAVFKQPARRKRSLSNAETAIDKVATLQLLEDKKRGSSATKTCPSPSPRRKMPNFAAIHQSIFQQMESLEDFAERKKERALALLNASSGPLFGSGGASVGAGANILKPVNRGGAIAKANLAKRPPSNLMKPKRGMINKRPLHQQSTTALKMSDKKLRAIISNSDFAVEGEGEEQEEQKDEQKPTEEPVIKETVDAVELKKIELPPPVVVVAAVKENVVQVKGSGIKEPKIIAKNWKINPKPTNLNVSSNRLKNRSVVSSLAKAKITQVVSRSQPTSRIGKPPVASLPKAAAAAPELNETAQSISTFTKIRGVRMNRHFDLLMKHNAAKK